MKRLLLLIGFIGTTANITLAQTIAYFEWVHQADSLIKLHQYDKAAICYDKALPKADGKIIPNDWYNAACIYALSGNKAKAFSLLDHLVHDVAFHDGKSLIADSDLTTLHEDPKWSGLRIAFHQKDSLDEAKINAPLRTELKGIFQADQHYRRQLDSVIRNFGVNSSQVDELERNMAINDSLNLTRVLAILDQYDGWPGDDIVGPGGGNTLWAVIQHADEHPEIQEKYLPYLRKTVEAGKAEPWELAYLQDRILVGQNKPQLYGTQLTADDKGYYRPFPIADSLNVDERRAKMGIFPLKYYLAQFNPGK